MNKDQDLKNAIIVLFYKNKGYLKDTKHQERSQLDEVC